MKLRSVLLRKRNAILLFVPILLLASYAIHGVVAQSGGIVGYSKIGCGTPYVGGCHGSQSSATAIKVSTDSAQILPGKRYVFRLTIANPTENAAGCDITADNGQLAVDGYSSGLQYFAQAGYKDLTHTNPQLFGKASGGTGDSAVWLFKYTPSKTGVAHIFIAANAVNLNGTNDAGDHWNRIVDTLNIAASGVTPADIASANLEIFPNPSPSGRYTISTQGLSGAGDIIVSNASGAIVSHSQITLGTNSPLDLSLLPKGTYFVSLRTKDGQQMMRRVVVAH